jgi:hypothetical protein
MSPLGHSPEEHPQPIRLWLPFLLVALLANGLCVWLGLLGAPSVSTLIAGEVASIPTSGSVLLTGLWISSPATLLLLPRRISYRHSAVWIISVAVACRLPLLSLTELAGTLFDLATLMLVLMLLRDHRFDPRWALLYACNPLVLYSVTGHGSSSVVLVMLITGAVWLYRKRRWPIMFLLLGLAVGGSCLELLLWPLFLRRDNLRYAWIAVVVALAHATPTFLTERLTVLGSLLRAGHSVAFDGPLCWLLQRLGFNGTVTVTCVALLVPVCLLGCWLNHPQRPGSRSSDPVNGLLAVSGAALLLSPTLHTEWLLLMIPLLAIRPLLSWLVLSGTWGLGLVSAGDAHLSGQPLDPLWLTPAVWIVPLLLLARELQLAVSRLRNGGPWPEPSTVSVVIPARNEAERLGACLAAISSSSSVSEVIVVDGGSSDSTRQVAEAAGARVIDHTAPIAAGGGRGGQINAGCRMAAGDLVAIVHADTCLEPGALDRALSVLACNPDAAGATLGARLDAPGIKLRLLEQFNDFRAALLGISFGDQVQLFRRHPLMERDLFPATPLMEDVELSLRLHRLGRVLFLWQQNLVSARRWQSGARWKTVLVNWLVAEYLLRRLQGSVDTVAMYKRYYGTQKPGV